jgi:carnitine 3-dehydrogenase
MIQRLYPSQVERVAIIGTGVIGSGWAAHFLAQGLAVTAYDPAPGAEERLRNAVAAAWPALTRLGLKDGADPARLVFADSLESAVSQAQFIQESAPERLPLKQSLLAEIDAAAPLDAIISSSTSGFAATDLQAECRNPERIVVGHPFNPPYLIPLVEVVGGEKTAVEVVDWTMDFYTAVGKRPLRLSRELPGFVANRLQEALWREALHMVNEGMATVSEIDAAIVDGPGLRWAIMGPLLIFHLAGGEGGMGHMLDHFDPNEFATWSKLLAPQITADLRQKMVDGCLEEANDRTIAQLERERDACLVAVLEAVKNCRREMG